jgi:multidrug efflux pump subunit AcrA (membrane-fusion protein)
MQKIPFMLAAALLVASGCSKKEEKEVEAPVPVQVSSVTQDTIRHVVAGDGALFPLDQQNVMPKITAPVKKFYVNRGDRVKQGQLLAVLENRDLTAQAAESKAALEQAESNLRMTAGSTVPESVVKAQTDVSAAQQAADAAKKVLESREQLLKEGALARRLVDEAQVAWAQANSQLLSAREHLRALQSVSKEEQVKTAAAQVDSAKAHLESTQAQVAYSEVRSPMNGVIADRALYAGDVASTGNPLFVIVDTSRVVARVNVPQSQAAVVKIGQQATVHMTDTTVEAEGKVTVVSPATDPNTTTVQVWVEVDNKDGRLKPGAAVHAAITAELFKSAAIVPSSAIFPGEEGGTSVVVIRDNVAHRRVVQVGVRDGDRVQIVSGVNPGEEIVIQGGMGVDDGAKVKVVDTTGKEDLDEEPDAPEAAPANKEQKKDEGKPKSK